MAQPPITYDPREALEGGYGVDRAQALYFPDEGRAGMALCLSGGGYRATLFHLGALTRLNELGVLSRMDTITSVSGGSILAGFLADRIPEWPESGPIEGWDRLVVGPVREFTARNIRTLWVLQLPLPWRWPPSTVAVRSLESTYGRHITDKPLSALPDRPRFVLCSTDLAFGQNWVATRAQVGDYEAGFAALDPAWPLARAIAVSSCFPPVFGPRPIGIDPAVLKDGHYRLEDRDDLVSGARLSDGGLYDNLGLEPVWKTHRTLLVSDGGGTFDFKRDMGFPRRLGRYLQVVEGQVDSVRKRWLIGGFLSEALEGTYWGIDSSPDSYEEGLPGYSKDLAHRTIAEIRTDLDTFSAAEVAVLENHGYLLADAAAAVHAKELLPAEVPPLEPPWPGWLDEGAVKEALAKSSKRRLLGHWRRR
jgi:NTE family protein